MKLNETIKAFIIKHNLIDFKTRNYKLSIVAMALNFFTAAFKIIAAFYISSYFLIVSSIYSVGIGMTKQLFFRGVSRSKEDPYKERKYTILIYMALSLSALVYSFYMIRLILMGNDEFNYGIVLSLLIALISLIEFITAIVGLVKSNQLKDTLLTAIKMVTLTSALVSMAMVQSAILTFLSSTFRLTYDFYISNAIVGLLVGISMSASSIILLYKHAKIKRKPLKDLTIEELWQLFPIFLVPHQKRWAKRFLKEKKYLLSHIKYNAVKTIEHIGSTAIPDIQAKNIIDIIVVVEKGYQMKDVAHLLETIGYIKMSESDQRISLNKGYTKHGYARDVFHIHLRYQNDIDEIYFRDYLINHREVALEYETLKIDLSLIYVNHRDDYTDQKTEFVKTYTEKGKKLYKQRGVL